MCCRSDRLYFHSTKRSNSATKPEIIYMESVNLSTFLITLSMKSTAKTCPDVLASSPVKRPIPAPSSSTDFPSYEGSKDRTYRKEAPTYQNFKPTRLQSQEH